MKKGKFGIVLCLYPIVAFICIILKLPLVWLPLVLAVFVEKDEWAGRQTLQALMLSAFVTFFGDIVPWAVSLLRIPFVSGIFSTVSTVLNILVYLAAIIFSILGIVRVMKDQDADLPLLSEIAYRAYGQRKPKSAPMPYYTPGQPPQYQQPTYPQQTGNAQPNAPQENGPQSGDPQ